MKYATWNVSTAGHGKSCADGVGGAVKGVCDLAILLRHDITSPQDIINSINKSKSRVIVRLIT